MEVLSATVCCKENQVFRIIMEKESTEFINLAPCVFMHQFSESYVMWSPTTERLGHVQKRIKMKIKGIQAAQESFCTSNA